MERDYKEDVKIDKYSLDSECEQQPSIYMYWSGKLAEEKEALDSVLTQLKLMKAKKDLYYRNNPLEGQKVTESSIKAMVDQDEDIVELRNKRTAAQKKVDVIYAAVNSLEHKRSQLKTLSELYISGYFSSPSGKRSSTDEKASGLRGSLNEKGEKDE